MSWLVHYRAVDDFLPLAQQHLPAHSARLRAFHERGQVLSAGPLLDPVNGAVAVFVSKEAAEQFIADDPFVTNGVVGSWTIRQWRDIFQE